MKKENIYVVLIVGTIGVLTLVLNSCGLIN